MYNTKTYDVLVGKLRTFFKNRGFIEVPAQSRLSILAACENPHSVATFEYDGLLWPLPQTGQMWLEYELLKNPTWPGCFCITTSYRNEQTPIEGRHEKIFPMFEFESRGTIHQLKQIEMELLVALGFGIPSSVQYEEMCQKYNTLILESEHEEQMQQDISNAISLEMFPLRTHPFWNMDQNEDGLFNKIDVILYGQETIGSAQRSCNSEKMKELFFSIAEGKYAEKLFELFGRNRVIAELDGFLKMEMFPRYGGGIGLTRLARAYQLHKKENLYEIEHE